MPLKKIKDKIQKEADQEIAEFKHQVEQKRIELKFQYENDFQEKLSSIKERAKSNIAGAQKSAELQLEMERKIKLLEAKSTALKAIFEDLKNDLYDNHLSHIYRVCLNKISNYLSEIKAGQVKIKVAKEDLELVKKLSEEYDLKAEFLINEERQERGIVTEVGDLTIDYTIDNLLAELLEKELQNIGKIIAN